MNIIHPHITSYLLLFLDILAEEWRDLVTEETLVVPPQMALDHDVAVGVQLLVPHQHPQVLVLDEGHLLEHGHHHGTQLLDLDDGERLDQQLLELSLSLLGGQRRVGGGGGGGRGRRGLVQGADLLDKALAEVLQNRVVEVLEGRVDL